MKDVSPGDSVTFRIMVTNDGPLVDGFRISGAGSNATFNVKYFVDAKGMTDITDSVTASGGYKISSLAAGESFAIKLKVKVKDGAPPGAVGKWLVTAKSTNDSHAKDAVQAGVTVVAR
jgi:uncharacterized membrane protein